MARRICIARKADGSPCGSPPLKDERQCLMHSPEHAQEVAESRRLGGLRRRREVAVTSAYEFEGVDTVFGIRRLLEIAIVDALGLENSISRARTLAYLAMTAIKLMEVGELELRIEALETAVHGSKRSTESVFDVDPTDNEFSVEVEP